MPNTILERAIAPPVKSLDLLLWGKLYIIRIIYYCRVVVNGFDWD